MTTAQKTLVQNPLNPTLEIKRFKIVSKAKLRMPMHQYKDRMPEGENGKVVIKAIFNNSFNRIQAFSPDQNIVSLVRLVATFPRYSQP